MQTNEAMKKRVYCKLNYHTFLQTVGLIRLGEAGKFRIHKPKKTTRYRGITDPTCRVLVFEYETEDAIYTICEPVYFGQIMDWFIGLGYDFYLTHCVYIDGLILNDRELFKFSKRYYAARIEKAELLTELPEEDFCEEQPALCL